MVTHYQYSTESEQETTQDSALVSVLYHIIQTAI